MVPLVLLIHGASATRSAVSLFLRFPIRRPTMHINDQQALGTDLRIAGRDGSWAIKIVRDAIFYSGFYTRHPLAFALPLISGKRSDPIKQEKQDL